MNAAATDKRLEPARVGEADGPTPASATPMSPLAPADAGGLTLDRLARDRPARVAGIDAGAAGQPPERARQLSDIGFVVGESVTVLAQAWPGGDPLVVLVGHSRFALRRAEAACIKVAQGLVQGVAQAEVDPAREPAAVPGHDAVPVSPAHRA